jgi:hypothetical protein
MLGKLVASWYASVAKKYPVMQRFVCLREKKNDPASRLSTVICSVTFRHLILSATVNATADFPTPAVPCSQMIRLSTWSSNNPWM